MDTPTVGTEVCVSSVDTRSFLLPQRRLCVPYTPSYSLRKRIPLRGYGTRKIRPRPEVIRFGSGGGVPWTEVSLCLSNLGLVATRPFANCLLRDPLYF